MGMLGLWLSVDCACVMELELMPFCAGPRRISSRQHYWVMQLDSYIMVNVYLVVLVLVQIRGGICSIKMSADQGLATGQYKYGI